MANGEIRSGKEVLDEFFDNLTVAETVDPETASAVIKLFKDGKLTATNLTNALTELREGGPDDEN